jgi:hypothetical protein
MKCCVFRPCRGSPCGCPVFRLKPVSMGSTCFHLNVFWAPARGAPTLSFDMCYHGINIFPSSTVVIRFQTRHFGQPVGAALAAALYFHQNRVLTDKRFHTKPWLSNDFKRGFLGNLLGQPLRLPCIITKTRF